MGVVYKARDTRLGRMVALKFLPRRYSSDHAALERFEREARAASALDHSNICTVYDIGEHEGQPFIAMQYLEGGTLKEKLASGPLSADEVIHFGIQLADALDVAHSHGIIHRDIKPANIFLTNRGETKILDFGVAKVIQHDSRAEPQETVENTLLTQEGTRVGTVAYMSPEQALGDEVDQRTDLFSLGVVLYEMAAGRPPFKASSPAAIIGQIVTYSPPSVASSFPALPAELDRIIAKAMAKEPNARYQSANEIRRALQRLRDVSSPEIQAVLADTSRTRKKQKRLLVGTAFLSAFVLLLLLALIGIYQSRPTEDGQKVLKQLTFEPGLQVDPAISPDGKFLAYASEADGNFDVWVIELGTDRTKRLSSSKAHDWQPAWSPNGDRIVFRSEQDGGGLYMASLDGGPPVKIAAFGYQPRWSPDGSRILFFNTPYTPYESREIYLVGPGGEDLTRIASPFLDRLILVTAGWHPDGRITVAGQLGMRGERGLWTGDIREGRFVRNEPVPEVLKNASELGLSLNQITSLAWDPTGRYLYFNGISNGVTNLWKVRVDPETLHLTSELERLTTGPGIDTNLSISKDGTKLVFNTIAESLRIWSFPLDSSNGRLTGNPQPVSPGGLRAAAPDLTEDGTRLLFAGFRADAPPRLWTRSMVGDGDPVSLGSLYGEFPRWSRDGKKLAYQARGHFRVVDVDFPSEKTVEASTAADFAPGTWSRDGEWILSSRTVGDARRVEIWKVPLHSEQGRRPVQLAAHPSKNLWQPRYSPDDRWISFNAVDTLQTGSSGIYVIPAEGGRWQQITSGAGWDDKPRWTPDSKHLYYLSSGGGFLDVWAIRFDPGTGRPAGKPFQLTHLDSPGRFVWQDLGFMELSLAVDRLVLPLMERTGHVWMLEDLKSRADR